MIWRKASSKSSLQALLESGKSVPRQPESVRARVLARATASVMSAPPLTVNRTSDFRLGRFPRHSVARVGAATLAVGFAGAVYALSAGWVGPGRQDAVQPAAAPSALAPKSHVSSLAPAPSSSATTASPPMEASAEPSRASSATPATSRPRQGGGTRATYDAELDLMRSAHTAYAAHDYASALVLAGEHARRFPGGVLAEQREALRVSSLVASGRHAEAKRAAAAFAKRFPRSVLLRKIQAETGTTGR